jgi:hypothetical protein
MTEQERKDKNRAYSAKVNAANKEYRSQYYQDHKAERAAYKLLWLSNPENVMAVKICQQPRRAFKLARTNKLNKFLGCTPEFFKQYISNLLTGEMTLENYGKTWCFDHIKPIKSFDLNNPEEVLKAAHYSNVQPILIIDNFKKSDKIDGVTLGRKRSCWKIDYSANNV